MSTIASLHSWNNGDVLTHTNLNGNFTEIRSTVNTYGLFTDVNRTITANLTFAPSSGVGITVSTGGITITAGGLTVTAGGATITAGNLAVTAGNLTFAAASAKLIPGATSFLIRNNADSADNVAITDAGAVTVRAGLTVSAGTTAVQALTTTGATISGQTAITLSHASARVVPGSTSLSFRNNGNSADNLLITDAGAVTTRQKLTVTAGGATINGTSSCVLDVGSGIALTTPSGYVFLGTQGNIAAAATTGFPVLPVADGTPSGAATAGAIVFYNNRIYAYNGSAWVSALLS